MQTVDELVVGAGLAGLHTARLQAQRELRVCESCRSTAAGHWPPGSSCGATLENLDLPEHLLWPAAWEVLLYPPSRRSPIRLRASGTNTDRVGDWAGLYEHASRAAESAGARVLLGVRYDGDVRGPYHRPTVVR